MARNNQNLGGVYANMDFQPYVWTEYPKHIKTGLYGQFEVAQNVAEERVILTKLQREHDNTPAEIIHHVADPEKEILISRARELNVPINPKWSKVKLEQVVKQAEDEIDNLPPEGVSIDDLPSATTLEAEVIRPHSESPEDEKARLYDEAKSLGLKTNGMHLWGVPRLKAAIAEAKLNQEE